MERHPDWLPRLEAYVAATRTTPFVWGQMDCALWAAGAVEAMTGEDLGTPFRGTYATREDGIVRAKALGFTDHADVFREALTSIPPAHATPGDVVLLPGRTLGILQGRFVWALSEHDGVVMIPAETARRAFRV